VSQNIRCIVLSHEIYFCLHCKFVSVIVLGPLFCCLMFGAMDSSDIIYVVTSDDDLPVCLQLRNSDGILQPRILPKSSQCFTSRTITVYDDQGNDIADDVTIGAYKYTVDENGEVYQFNTQNEILSSNCLASVSSDSCTKSTSEEVVIEPNLVTNLKTCDVHMTFSQDCSRTNQQDAWSNSQGINQIHGTVTDTGAVPVNFSAVTTGSCVKHFMDDSSFQASAVEMTADSNQNTDLPSTVYEKNLLSDCVNSPLSPKLQSVNCSVPSLPESLCHSIPDDVNQVNLATGQNCRTTCHLPVCLSHAAKYATVTTETIAASCKVGSAFTNIDSCNTISSLTIEHLQPCASFSEECCMNSCSREHSSLCQQSTSPSNLTELNSISDEFLLADSCSNVKSVPSFVSSDTDIHYVDNEANASSCTHSSKTETLAEELVADYKFNSSESHYADHIHKTNVSGSYSPEHGICSCSLVAKSDFCKMEQLADDHISVTVSDLSVSDACASKPNQYDANGCSEVVTMPGHDVGSKFDVPLIIPDRADHHMSETEMQASSSISVDALDHSETEGSFPLASNDGNTVEGSIQQKDVESLSYVMNTNDMNDMDRHKREVPSDASISVNVADYTETECSYPSANFDSSTAEDSVQQKDIASNDPDDMGSNEQEMSSSSFAVVKHSGTECLLPLADYDGNAVEDPVQQKDVESQNQVINTDDLDDKCHNIKEMPSNSSISADVGDHSETECLYPSANFDSGTAEDSVQQKDIASNDPDNMGSNKQEMSSSSFAVVKHSRTECLLPLADYDGNAVEDSVQQKDIESQNHVISTDDLDDKCHNIKEMPSNSSISADVGDHSETECLCLSASFDSSIAKDYVQQRDVSHDPDDMGSNKQDMPSNSSILCSVENHGGVKCLFPSADNNGNAVEDLVQQKDVESLSHVMNTNDLDDMDKNKREVPSYATISVDVADYMETECSYHSTSFDSSIAEDSVQQKDIASNELDSMGSNKQEMSSNSSILFAVQNYSGTECLFTSSDNDGNAVEDPVQQKGVTSLSSVINTTDLDVTGSDKQQQNVTDTANTDCILQRECTKKCTYNGSFADSVVNNNSSFTLDTDSTLTSKESSVLEPMETDTTDSVVHIVGHEFDDETNGHAEYHMQPLFTAGHIYSGCQWDNLKAVRNFHGDIHEMRQKLRALHKAKHRLKKLLQNKPVASSTDRLQSNILNLLHDVNCSKKLRLEALEHELADRAILLQHREEQMDLRLQRVEQHEQALCEREQLLTQAQYCILAPQQEQVEVMTDVQSQSVQKYPATDHNSDVAESNQKTMSKHMPQRRTSSRISKQKVFAYFLFQYGSVKLCLILS